MRAIQVSSSTAHPDYSTVEHLFRGVLGRVPSSRETAALTQELKSHGNLEAITRDLILSEEFAIQMLPQLVVKWSRSYQGRSLFFLHVPKTAGTSIRLALSSAMGIPSLHLYRDFIQPRQTATFWPLWSGHAAIARFPLDRPGLTIFRETRSRLLSWYRQRELEARGRQRIPLQKNVKDINSSTPLTPANIWILNRARLEAWFHLDSDGRIEGFQGWTRGEVLDSLSRKALKEGITRGLEHIHFAAWSHKKKSLDSVIQKATGSRGTRVPHLNALEQHTPDPEVVELTKTDLAILNQAAERDQLVFDIAVSMGLIESLSTKEADKLFLDTAKRHRFVLP